MFGEETLLLKNKFYNLYSILFLLFTLSIYILGETKLSTITKPEYEKVLSTTLTTSQLLFSFLAKITPNKKEYVTISADVPHSLLFEKSCKTIFFTGGCKCLTGVKRSKCCCVGQYIRQIPQNFTPEVAMIFFYDVGILEIREDDFDIYPYLEEIIIDNAKELRNVEGGSFKNLTHLRKLQISKCPNLERWSNTLLKTNFKIQSIIAYNNGLQNLPKMEMIPNLHHFLTMEVIDFSGNRIRTVETGTFLNVASKELRLARNQIQRIESGAFTGSKFYKIALNENYKLSDISTDAFENISDLHHLDLSHSKITKLPVKGLKLVKRITLQNVPTLKQLPSVLEFINLNKAEFTYSYHCCFFKHANREYQKGDKYMEHYKEIQHRLCRRKQIFSTPESFLQFQNKEKYSKNFPLNYKKRFKRNIDANANSGKTIGNTLTQWYKILRLGSAGGGLSNETSASASYENLEDYKEDEFEVAAYSGNNVGQSVVLKKCVESAVNDFYLNVSCTPQSDALNPCEDIVSYYPLRYMIWIMCIGAIVGNIAVWIVITAVWQRRMRLHYFFMLNVSFADFLTGVYLAILAIQDLKTLNDYYNYAVEWQTGWGCSLAGFISVFASQLSIYSMLLIAVEIYYNAKYAFYGRRMSTKCACILMAFGYLYAFSMACLPLVGISSFQHSSICLPLSINKRIDQIYLLFGLLMSSIAFACMIVNYIMINCMIRSPNSPSRQEDSQILKRTFVLIGTDMICWVPTLFLAITAAMGMPLITLTNAKICLILFYPINSCANPLLYVFLTKIWKDAKLKAIPIFEIISSRSQNHLQHSKHHLFPIKDHQPQQGHPCSLYICNLPTNSKFLKRPLQRFLPTLPIITTSRFLFGKIKKRTIIYNKNTVTSNFKRPAARVVIPKMSDIFESSSNSCMDLNEFKSQKRRKSDGNTKGIENLIQNVFLAPQNSFSLAPALKHNSDISIGRDSGQGDSLTSNILALNRPSVVTINWKIPPPTTAVLF